MFLWSSSTNFLIFLIFLISDEFFSLPFHPISLLHTNFVLTPPSLEIIVPITQSLDFTHVWFAPFCNQTRWTTTYLENSNIRIQSNHTRNNILFFTTESDWCLVIVHHFKWLWKTGLIRQWFSDFRSFDKSQACIFLSLIFHPFCTWTQICNYEWNK